MDLKLTVDVLTHTRKEVAYAAAITGTTVATMPAGPDVFADFVKGLVGVYGDDFANNLVPGDSREAGRKILVTNMVVAGGDERLGTI